METVLIVSFGAVFARWLELGILSLARLITFEMHGLL